MPAAIPFNRPHMTGLEQAYIAEVLASGKLSGDGPFTRRCHARLAELTGSAKVLLTHSCTAALEMAAMLLNLGPGDEVILPSFSFVSTANAVVLRGATPVFADIAADTLNIDPRAIQAAVTPRTRAVFVVHYAGVGCDMDAIGDIARHHGLAVVEDAAQAVGAWHCGRALGSIGDIGAFSFHDTKNLGCGEGGALLLNRPEMLMQAEILREKGTDRSRFLRGEVDKYTWQDLGSSYLPSELQAAMLQAQLERCAAITTERVATWNRYHALLAPLEARGELRRPTVPAGCEHNGHIYYVLLPRSADRDALIAGMRAQGVVATFHYVPLHSAPAGRRYGRAAGDLAVTVDCAARLVRLPLWTGLGEADQIRVVDTLQSALRRQAAARAVAG